MNRSILSTAPTNPNVGFVPQPARSCRLGPAVIIAMAAAAAGAAARPSYAQSLPAAWVADERTAEHRGGQSFAERTPAPASPAAQPDGRNNAVYAPPTASPGMRPQRIEPLGNAGRPNAATNDVVPIAHLADAPAGISADDSAPASAEAARPVRRLDSMRQTEHAAPAVSLSPPRPESYMEPPPPESRSSERPPEDANPRGANGEIGSAPDRQPTLLPPSASKPLSDPVSLTPHRQSDNESSGSSVRALGTIAGSLAIVLTLLFVALWLLRRTVPPAAQPLPVEVVEVLGRAPLSGRQQMHLLRCGRKLLLVSVTPECAKTLTEITDPLEVDRLAGLCQQTRPNSATAAFRRVFEQFASAQSEK